MVRSYVKCVFEDLNFVGDQFRPFFRLIDDTLVLAVGIDGFDDASLDVGEIQTSRGSICGGEGIFVSKLNGRLTNKKICLETEFMTQKQN